VTRPLIGLVVNPASNKGRAARTGQRVAEVLRSEADVQVFAGCSPDESLTLIAEAARASDAVLTCGGDGLVHLAVNVLAGGNTPLGIVPAGTGNDNADILGLPADAIEAARVLLAAVQQRAARSIDLGWCDAPPLIPATDGRWYMGVLYGGFDSAVNERANRLSWPKGKLRYDIAILCELAALSPRQVTLILDEGTPDERQLSAPITLVAIGNTRQYGGGKLITPDARPDDGIFDLTVVGPISRRRLARIAPKLPKAGHIGEPEVTTYRAKSVRFEGHGVVAYADGERLTALPLTTRVVSRALSVLVPPTAGYAALGNNLQGAAAAWWLRRIGKPVRIRHRAHCGMRGAPGHGPPTRSSH